MATQSGGKTQTFAEIAAKQLTNLTSTANIGYARRRAVKFTPCSENETIQRGTFQSFIESLQKLLTPSAITTLRRSGENEIHAILETPTRVDSLLKLSPITVAGQKLTVTPFAPRSVKIWLYNPSLFVGKDLIREELQKNIPTSYIEELKDEYNFPTGKLFAYVRGTNIPSAIHIGSVRINITYPGMERRCRLCQALDHVAGSCPNRQCYNCNKAGHVSAECTAGCRRCGATDHSTRTCGSHTSPNPDVDSTSQFPNLQKTNVVPKLAELAWRAAKTDENRRRLVPPPSPPPVGETNGADAEEGTQQIALTPPSICPERSDMEEDAETQFETE